MGSDLVAFSYANPPDPTTFKSANYSRFAEMAEFYDNRYENYHIPLNMSTDTSFKDVNCTDVNRYHFSDNTGQWTGLAITGWVFKYVTALNERNSTMKNDSLRVIRKLMHGMSMQLIVPNGGLGPNFSGILARGWAGPQHHSMPGVEWYFGDGGGRHYNGTGDYSNWRWRAFTSNDEYSGFYSGLALVFKYVQEQDVQHLATLMIDQVLAYMLDTNFLGIDWHGGPTGVRQKPIFFTGGAWAALALKMGAMALPDKYERLYCHYVVENFYAQWATEGGEHETVMNYYAFAFGYHVVMALILLEGEGKLFDLYLSKYHSSLRQFTANHRNPFYNIIELVVTHKPGDNLLLERDVEDILTRYDCEYHFPDRALGHANISDDYVEVDNVTYLANFLENDSYGPYYAPTFMEVSGNQIYYQKPLTPEYMNGNIFIWEKNPYSYRPPWVNSKYEFASYSFSCVYWTGRAFGFIAPNGTRGDLSV
jgi:hypothetical protein